MNDRPPIRNLATFEGLDDTERELTISKLIIEVHDWLTATDDDTPVWEFSSARSYMADIVSAIRRLSLNSDLRLDALLVLRLTERAVGKSVRRGQAAGELGSLSSNGPYSSHGRLPSPQPYIGQGTTAHVMYQLTDGVTDAQFAAVLKEARADGKLSRTYIARKVIELQTGKKPDTRRELVESTRELAEQLRKVTVRLRSLADDDRLGRNKAEVAARMRPYLDTAVAVCTELKKTLEEK